MISQNLNNIASYILSKNTNLSFEKLNILLYYCQGWYLALNNKNLFEEDFTGGVFGPIIIPLYDYYKNKDIKLTSYRQVVSYTSDWAMAASLSKNLKSHIDEVLDIYENHTMSMLTDMIRHEFPYINSRKKLKSSERGKNIILKSDMKRYFLNQLDKPNIWLVKEKFLEFWDVLFTYLFGTKR